MGSYIKTSMCFLLHHSVGAHSALKMKFLVASLFLILLGAGAVQSFGDELSDIIFKQYAMLKIFEDCYGKDTVKGMFKEVKQACRKCKSLPLSSTFPTSADFMMMSRPQKKPASSQQKPASEINKKPVRPQIQAIPLVYHGPLDNSQVSSLPFFVPYYNKQYYRSGYPMMQYKQRADYNPYEMMMMHADYRQKRDVDSSSSEEAPTTEQPAPAQKPAVDPVPASSPAFSFTPSPDKVQKMIAKIYAKINNVTCVMRELGFLDAYLQPDYESMRMRIEELPISDEMKSDLCEGIDTCREFSSCVPLKKISQMPILKDLAKPMMFFKCFKGKKLETCMKKDLREKIGAIMGLDENLLMMSREMGDSDMTGDENGEGFENIFNIIYGFTMNSGMGDVF